jgi:4-amino-4-deoxychorismate lyase
MIAKTMCLLLESIRVQDGALVNVRLHNDRMNRSRRALFSSGGMLDLGERIVVPEEFRAGIVKCRVLYREAIERVEFAFYRRRVVRSLQLVRGDTVEYAHKYEDKSALHALLARRGECDDILIVKNGRITDTSFSNIALFDGTHWVTPDAPLLEGTMRAGLIAAGRLVPVEIRVEDLGSYREAHCINCMCAPGDIVVPVERIMGGTICT